jgi:hypothetical protein
VFTRISGAVVRGLLVALMIAMPLLLLPGHTTDAAEIVALLAIVGAALTIANYNTDSPSIVEFRDALPLNRLSFVALFLMVLLLTLATSNQYEPSGITRLFAGSAR